MKVSITLDAIFPSGVVQNLHMRGIIVGVEIRRLSYSKLGEKKKMGLKEKIGIEG